MAKLQLKSQRQIQTDLITTLIAELGLNDINPGSVLDVLTSAIAQEDFAQYVQMAQIARLVDLDAITDSDLDNKAFEYGITRRLARAARGKVSILRPENFVKVSTNFFAGSPAPIIGNTSIDVNDASSGLIGSSGTLILGRGTTNEEEVTYSVVPTNNINYFTFTLDNPLTKNHAIEESVILKQGNDQLILAGTQVRVPSTGTNSEIIYTLDNDALLFAGEARLDNVDVTAQVPGSSGNIAIKSIQGQFGWVSQPFPGARVENISRFTSGRDYETDDELRDRIRSTIQSLSRGVKEAILNAIVGLVDTETAKRVVSANVIPPLDECGPVKVYIDDGTGFEPSFSSRGFEEIVRSATGGEERLQLELFPIVKAQIETNLQEPYNMSGVPLTLTYNVGTQSETVNFVFTDFEFPDNATAEEIVTAINDKATLIEARTSQNGQKLVITAKKDINESLQVTGGTANSILGFPVNLNDTLYLFKDDILMSKDGETAFLDSQNQSPYNFMAIGPFPHTLTFIIDGKTANPQTVTFQALDFSDPTSISPQEIVKVINDQLVGALAETSDNNTRVRITSNTKLSSKSRVQITGGSANDSLNGLNFTTIEKVGVDRDYTLNRELGIIELNEPLIAGSSITAGSLFTRAKIRAALPENYSPVAGQTLDIVVDGGSTQTITFDVSFLGGVSAEGTSIFINNQLEGATAYVRQIAGINYLEISTNTYLNGTIEILSTSTGNGAFNFPLDEEQTSQIARKAYRVSGNSGPYSFKENDSLVVILDNDIINSTFSVVLNYAGEVTNGVSTTQFANSDFGIVFPINEDIKDYDVSFLDGANTVLGNGTTVTDQGGDIFRVEFSVLPVDLNDISIGDLVKITNFNQNGNNGFFKITAVNTVGNGYIEFENENGIPETLGNADVLMSQTRNISQYIAVGGQITVSSAFANIPAITDPFIILPTTTKNLVEFLNNTKITSLSTKADIESVEDGTKVQISSKKDGSDGYIQVAGGLANSQLNFNTEVLRGLTAYDYYTGLVWLVHRTIYGDDSDLITFPGIGAAGITFQVLAPTVREVAINLNVTLREGISIASLENEIKSEVTAYINNLGVGQDIIIEEIRARVIRIAGVSDVVLNSPTQNIAIAQNELGRTRESLILVG
ncbi:MAG: hypothetical protein MOGMAGMI_00393 [Candidatus Omnitrophica bacterium]|nr:hypothetical protein [Candidatus Omnitrophota bacterium]